MMGILLDIVEILYIYICVCVCVCVFNQVCCVVQILYILI